MSNNNFWQQEDEFRDNPVEMTKDGQWQDDVTDQLPPRNQKPLALGPMPGQQNEEHYEGPVVLEGDPNLDLFPDGDPDEEEDYTAVLSDARLRLEQGKLYELIMNHDLFSGENADPRAVKHVQREIKKFAKERMEVMLGMRRDTAKVERLEIDFPFNQVEVDVLKRLAYAASKGASTNSDNFVPKVTKTTQEVPVVQERKPTTLNPIGSNSKKSVPQKLPAKPQAPVQRKAAPAKELTENESLKRELDYKPLEKAPQEMDADELIKRNKESAKRLNKQVPSKFALQQPTFEEQQMLHSTRAAAATPAVSAIIAAINNNKK